MCMARGRVVRAVQLHVQAAQSAHDGSREVLQDCPRVCAVLLGGAADRALLLACRHPPGVSPCSWPWEA